MKARQPTARDLRKHHLHLAAMGDAQARESYVALARVAAKHGDHYGAGTWLRRARECRMNELRLAVDLGLRKTVGNGTQRRKKRRA